MRLQVVIPKGWRRLKVASRVLHGDMFAERESFTWVRMETTSEEFDGDFGPVEPGEIVIRKIKKSKPHA